MQIPIEYLLTDPGYMCQPHSALARYIPHWHGTHIEIYLAELNENALVESFSACILHEILHWQLDLSGESQTEDIVVAGERRAMAWLFQPDYRIKVMAKMLAYLKGWQK